MICVWKKGRRENEESSVLLGFWFKEEVDGRVQWLTSVIPALWETEEGGSWGQEFKTSLANMVKPHLC